MKSMVYWAKKMNERGLVTARSGNISLKVKEGILITSQDCYLGELKSDEILLVDANGRVLGGDREITSEKDLHLNIHRRFKETKVVFHAHSPYTTAFYHYFDKLDIFSFEARFYLGDIKVIPQLTPTVTDLEPVLKELENTNIVVLGEHGVVSVGHDFNEAFSLIELLEEQAKINLLLRTGAQTGHFGAQRKTHSRENDGTNADGRAEKKYLLLSKEHVQRLVELVNNDADAQTLGKQYGLTCTLAVRDIESGSCVCFYYKDGKIIDTDTNENAEFVISGKSEILKKVFNRVIDPFVATTQGKVKTKGDISKMSRWYPVLVRTFKLWEKAPVE